jgi:hypothetical protein
MTRPDGGVIDHVVEDLAKEFGDRVDPIQVREEVDRAYGELSRGRIKAFVPALTRKVAREQLLRRT